MKVNLPTHGKLEVSNPKIKLAVFVFAFALLEMFGAIWSQNLIKQAKMQESVPLCN